MQRERAKQRLTLEIDQGRKRVTIEGVKPEIDGGRFPAKRAVGESLIVEADIFADGHDALSAVLLYRKDENADWIEARMKPLVNDRWQGQFEVSAIGTYRYTVRAWVDRFESWRQSLAKKLAAKQDVAVDLLAGAELVGQAAKRAGESERKRLEEFVAGLRKTQADPNHTALSTELADLMAGYSDRRWAVTYDKELRVTVDRDKARFSSWYEMFPRSCGRPGEHGTLRDCEQRLPYVAEMGFDVLYLPPIHPIGVSFRKGKNNTLVAEPDAVGSPWAIGSAEGGHKSVHPQLGALDDFKRLVAKAKEYGIEIALDIAFQCTPDHPYVAAHPEWFRKRPDGTIQYAENPPKKYQDIYPIDFESDKWQELWEELKGVFLFWIEHGVRIFRVDNPHTKPFVFWEWVIGEIKKDYPETIFLAEAFTRPKVMYRLAKVGFSQSYTYFSWRNTQAELTQYFTELTQADVRDFFRPSLWPNTPDILTEYLQLGGRPAFMTRLVLAATLGASYGIYGPAYELCENVAREPGSEEYFDSEKYELKHWELDRPESLRELIAQVNRIRKENPALQNDRNLRFHSIDNKELICFSKATDDGSNTILVTVNLDPHHTQAGWVELPLGELRLDPDQPFQVHDLLTGARYLWHGSRNYVQLDPRAVPAHIFRVRHRVRREQDFDYFM
ncbi:MAG: alpha-1,4-glucan--maltose-1-phosphate maltosyltransferase [Candidatus Binatia bacterium]